MAEGCPASVCLGLDLRICVSTCVCKTLCTSVHVSVHVSARGYRSICLCEYVPLVCVYARVCAGCLPVCHWGSAIHPRGYNLLGYS